MTSPHYTVDGLGVWAWPSAVPESHVAGLETLVTALHAHVGYMTDDDGYLALRLALALEPYLEGAPPLRWCPQVNLARLRMPLDWHLDRDYGEQLRFLLYFGGGGGVEFRSGLVVGGRRGDLVLFDRRLEHRSEVLAFRPGKLVLGMRAQHARDVEGV